VPKPGLAELGKQIKEAGGPTAWVFSRITEFMIGMAVGTAVGIADEIERGIDAVQNGLEYAAEGMIGAYSGIAQTAIGAQIMIFDALASAAELAGPLGPIVWVGSALATAVIVIRVGRALMDSLPIASGVQTLLEGR